MKVVKTCCLKPWNKCKCYAIANRIAKAKSARSSEAPLQEKTTRIRNKTGKVWPILYGFKWLFIILGFKAENSQSNKCSFRISTIQLLKMRKSIQAKKVSSASWKRKTLDMLLHFHQLYIVHLQWYMLINYVWSFTRRL